ncbi:hypothetical protein GPALN_005347 [Globodera pallida]|nr:hypothetical protein GPALN_005347 [Globodera pallida]
MSKNSYSNGLQSNQSNSSISTFEHGPLFTVCELTNTGHDNQSLFLKLTDECSAAIRQAIKLRRAIRMHIRKQEAEIEIDGREAGSTIFKCTFQNQTETDSVCFDPKENVYKNVGPATKTRLQVQATAKAFADMKEKTQKLVEAEQQKKAKDMPKSQKKHNFAANEVQPQRQVKSHSSFLAKFASKRTHSPSPVANTRKFTSAPAAKQQRQTEAKQEAPIPQTKLIPFEMREKIDDVAVTQNESTTFAKTNISQKVNAVEFSNVKQIAKVIEQSSPKKDLFYIPKRKPLHGAPSISPASTATSTPKTISPPFLVRPASVDSTLQHSSSCSPEDSVGSMTIPTKPSRDWSQEFGVLANKDDAERYHSIFKNEYPEYRRYYDDLTRVAEDFISLKSNLARTNDELEGQTMTKLIREKFSNLQNDQQFMYKRQRHTDLHAKLNVIKKALEEWNKRVESSLD